MPLTWNGWTVRAVDNAFNLAGRLADNPATEGPTYPTQSECWVCGTIVFGQPTLATRRCSNGHEEVQWLERLPGVAELKRPGNERTLHTSCP